MSQTKKSRWPGRFWALIAILILAALIFALQQNGSDELIGGSANPFFFFLIELNVVLLAVLAFLIGRSLIRLIFDRKRRILGSAIRMRLVLAFLGLTLVPIAVVFMLASGLLNTVMQGWFSTHVETAVEGAVEVARKHYESMQEQLRLESVRMKQELERSDAERLSAAQRRDKLEKLRSNSGLFAIKLLDQKGVVLAEAKNAASMIDTFEEPKPEVELLRRAINSETSVTSRRKEGGQFIEAYLPLRLGGESLAMVVTSRLNPELSQIMGDVNSAYNQYQQLKFHKDDLRSGYFLVLSMITASILFGAIWTGLFIARVISVPIQELAQGTRAVASGDYSVKIETRAGDEIGLLVDSFNQMTSDLKHSREEVERRQVFLETVLAKLAVGVISLDAQARITSINSAAAKLLWIADPERFKGASLEQALSAELNANLKELLEALHASLGERAPSESSVDREFTFSSGEQELKVVCTAGYIVDRRGEVSGSLLLFDDVTALAKAQSVAVWREVARRIAHEIKNPLTPIQLSAQRIDKAISAGNGAPVVQESVQTILENVDSIKRLANEFSNFARMPRAEFEPANLNLLISDAIEPYAESHSEIVFQFVADDKLPEVRIDREQMRRVLINLIDNAVDALERAEVLPTDVPRRVVIKTQYDRRNKSVLIEVADNGPGIPGSDRLRIFEPYFTTKKRGTGLGLAIVNSIVSDHQGQIKVYENSPRGAKFIVEFPTAPKDQTQRKLAGAEV